jgi:maleate isomerase
MPHPYANRPRDSLGYRAILGVLVPYTNTIVQPEYEAFRPAGVTNHVARMEQTATRPITDDAAGMEFYRQRLSRDTEHVKKAIDEVLPAEPHAIVVGHSIDSFRGGVAGSDKMKADLEAHAKGVPVFLPAHGFLAALKTLGVGRRLSAITPYFSPGDEQVRAFFEDAGFEIVRIVGLKRGRGVEIAATPAQAVMDVLKEIAADKPDVIVQPGTNLSTARLSADASAWLGIPVVSCNTATYWHALRTLGIMDRMEGFGPLFAAH